jgi:hypothetical protein
MHFTGLLTRLFAILSMASLIMASPLPADATSTAAELVTGTTADGSAGGVYVCNEENWNGFCTWLSPSTFAGADCKVIEHVRPDGVRVIMNIKSIGPDGGGACQIYSGEHCQGYINTIWAPGQSQGLGHVGSIKCFSY